MKKSAVFVGFVVLLLALGGCGQLTSRSGKTPSDQEYVEQARTLEAQGNLPEALKTYKLARTVNPNNELANKKIAELEPKLTALAETHYQTGMAYQRKGQYAQAQQEFMTALRYNPDHLQAQQMLSGRAAGLENVKGYIPHVVEAGESLSLLAKRYYGDYKKFHFIAEFNGLDDATRISAGQMVKIPVIQGIPLLEGADQVVTEGGKSAGAMPAALTHVKKVVTHTIQPGETLSILSKRYYGDINHYDLIARFNGLEDPTNIQLGQQIKIPQVEGLPFMEEEAQPQGAPVQTPAAMKSALPETPAAVKGPVPQTPAPTVGTPSEKVEPAVSKENRPSLDEEVAGYREQGIEFYNDKNYADAINEFDKVLSARPADQAAGKYMALSYYELGTQSYQKQDYAQAIQKSKKALEYDPGCANCQALVKKSEESFKDIHYRKGLDYFTNEKLADAIREWQLVYDMDPHYEDVDRNLQKARLLQERLDAIRRSKQGAQ